MSNELKPCPFCGGSAEADKDDDVENTHPYQAYCVNAECVIYYPMNSYPTLEKAVTAWNTRAMERDQPTDISVNAGGQPERLEPAPSDVGFTSPDRQGEAVIAEPPAPDAGQPDDCAAAFNAWWAKRTDEFVHPDYAQTIWDAAWASKPERGSVTLSAKGRESGWIFIEFGEDGRMYNYPKHEQEVLFVYGQSIYAGCFLDDVRESSYPDGEEYEGDFGFYTMDDKFYETEHVRCWMPSPTPPEIRRRS